MRSFSKLAILALPLFSTVIAEAPASPTQKADRAGTVYTSAQEAFQDLLNALPEESLQAALSGLKGFKDGVFESHHRGVEHVHDNNPALATKLIVAAVQDLKKRQANPANGTFTSAQPPAQSSNNVVVQQTSAAPAKSSKGGSGANSPAPSSSAPRPAVIPVEVTTTEDGKTVVSTTSILSEVTASVAVTVVGTNSEGQTVTSTETRPAVIMTTTDSAGSTTVATSAANLLPTAGEVVTTTDAQGSTFLTTYTPAGGKISSVKLITTTGANGQPSTMTSYTYVDPAQTQADSPSPTTGKPGLQSNAARKNAALELAVVGAGALAFFV